jgi:hypothetical protein
LPMFVLVLLLQSSIYEIKIDRLMLPLMALLGHTQHLLPYVVGTKEMTSFAR